MKGFIGFLIGIGIGGFVGYEIGLNTTKKKVWAEANAEIQKVIDSVNGEKTENTPKTDDIVAIPAMEIERLMQPLEPLPPLSDYVSDGMFEQESMETQLEIARTIDHAGDEGGVHIAVNETEYAMCDYRPESITYHADGVMVDESGHRLSDDEVFDMLGRECPLRMKEIMDARGNGEIGDDVLYVINDDKRLCFEVAVDLRTYHEVVEASPYLMEDD